MASASGNSGGEHGVNQGEDQGGQQVGEHDGEQHGLHAYFSENAGKSEVHVYHSNACIASLIFVH